MLDRACQGSEFQWAQSPISTEYCAWGETPSSDLSFAAPSPRLIPEGKHREPLPGWRGTQIKGERERGAMFEQWEIDPLWNLADPLTIQQAAYSLSGLTRPRSDLTLTVRHILVVKPD